jgi:hypothetical protein
MERRGLKEKAKKSKNAIDVIIAQITHRNIRYMRLGAMQIRPADPVYILRLPISAANPVVSSGAYAYATAIALSNIAGYSSRVAPMFREAMILKAEFDVFVANYSTSSVGAPGQWAVWVRETDTSTPTAADARDNQVMMIPNNSSQSFVWRATWSLSNPNEAAWTLTSSGSPPVVCTLKIFANTSAPCFFVSGDNASNLVVQGYLTVAFRSFTAT